MYAQEALEGIGYSTEEARKILPSLFLYLFRAFKMSELHARAQRINPEVDLFKLTPHLPLMGDINLHDKACIYALYKGMDPGVEPQEYIESVVLKSKEVRRHLKLFGDLPAYSVKQIQVLESRCLMNKEIKTYTRKFIQKKMRFIISYYGVSLEELEGSLQERAIYNLRINYPNWNTSGEMLAMAKSAIANAGQNLIKYYAAGKRARVNTANKGVEYSLDTMQELSGDAPEYQAVIYSDVFDRGMEILEASLSIDGILNKLTSAKREPEKKLLIQLLSGRFHEGFSNYLSMDSQVYASSVTFEQLLNKACTYIGVDKEKAQSYLCLLR